MMWHASPANSGRVPQSSQAEVQELPEEEEQGTDGVEVTVDSDEAHESKGNHPVMTVAAVE